MAQILSQELEQLSLNNNSNKIKIHWNAVLYADYARDQYIIILKNIHYYEEIYFEYGWQHVDDIILEFIYENNLQEVNFFFEDEANILAWPYDFAPKIVLYNLLRAGKLDEIGYLYFHPNSNIFMPPCPGEIELWSDPLYNKWRRCPLTIRR